MAGPTVKISAYNSKPSNSQPRLAASRMFHWWRLRPRYHGCRKATVSVMGVPLSVADPPTRVPCNRDALPLLSPRTRGRGGEREDRARRMADHALGGAAA